MHFIQRAISRFTSRKSLTILTLVLVLIILIFGLHPNTWPNRNEVHWSADKGGLLFHNPGFAYIDDLTTFTVDQESGGFSISLMIAVDNLQNRGFKPIVMLHNGTDADQLTISQWGTSIIAMNGDDYSYSRRLPRISAEKLLVADVPNCIIITSGPNGTHLYSNGSLIQENRDLKLRIPQNGGKLRLVLGNSIYGNTSWEGVLYNLTMYRGQLSPENISEKCAISFQEPTTPIENTNQLRLSFSFETEKRNMMQDQSGNNQSLLIPSRPLALEKSFLAPPWHNFSLSRNIIADIIVNLIGFIPFGAVLYARLRLSAGYMGRYPARATVLLIFILSLSIELAQAWLPLRTSSMLDLILNTLGGILGTLLILAAGSPTGKSLLKCWQRVLRAK